jgi:hypothetical protein
MYGYPDDIGGVYSADGSVGNLGVLVVNPSPERTAELLEIFSEVTPCKYSYNELMLVHQEIVALMGPESLIYGCGIGGFHGPSGKEFRVTVSVDESAFDRYTAEFAALYGDMTHVEMSLPLVPDSDYWVGTEIMPGGAMAGGGIDSGAVASITPDDPSGSLLLWAMTGVGLLGVLTTMLWRRSRLVPAMQTANGGGVAQNGPVSKSQAIAAVKESGSAPGDGLFDAISKKIDGPREPNG